ncbi:DUF1453 domain-containing protein [Kitasatospora sp. NPDC004240]
MNTLADVLTALVVVVVIVHRQLKARPVESDRHLRFLPVVLGLVALRDPDLIDHDHLVASVALLVASLVAVLGMGVVWGWTVRIWYGEDGRVWARGTAATAAAWAGMIALRGGLFGLGLALDVHQGTSVLLLGLAVLLPTRAVVVNWRARGLERPYHVVKAA